MEDLGPQKQAGGLDIEGAVGRPSVERASKSPGPVAGEKKDEDMKESGEDGKDESKEGAEEKKAEKDDVDMKSDD